MILRLPELLLLYGCGFACILLDNRWKASHGWLTWIGGALCVAAVAALLLAGASLWEAVACLTALLLALVEGEKA